MTERPASGPTPPAPPVDVVIVNYNTDTYLHQLLRSVERHLPADAVGTVHVWDNGSTDRSRALLDRFVARATWLTAHLSDENIHHGPALDRMLVTPDGHDWVLLLDADTELTGDIRPAVPRSGPPPAFVGQIHPLMPHLYAYLAHLLVHRPTYRDLPPFRHHGAPGIDYFRAIETRGLPYGRFRWTDVIDHAGQASLRGVYARGDTAHPFYRFAAREQRARPASDDRRRRERESERALATFLAGAPPARSPGRPRVRSRVRAASATHRSAAPPTPVRAVAPASFLRDPWAAWHVARARRIGLVQQTTEIVALVRRLRRRRPRRVLEIGTAHGGTLYLWTRAAAPDATLVSIDLPPWELDDPWEPAKVQRLARFGRARQRLHLVRGDSHDPETRARLHALAGDEPFDFVFIDGDHTYAGVRLDYEWYGRLARAGGLVALHDIHPHSRGWGGDVPRFWNELRQATRSTEIIAHPGQDGFGLGLVET